ncbi:MAG: type II toxin-antitoxin system RelE/ParE family toxin [Phreatobacter sp.]|nr:type II toxin-antitoxin system RelE/ParE family toxin [Phreatobacter sp.]
MKLIYTPQALAELDAVLDQLGEFSPQGAERVRGRIRATINLVVRHPHVGQKTNVADLRRIVVTPYPYLVFYRPSETHVVIIAVRHAARDPQTMPGR